MFCFYNSLFNSSDLFESVFYYITALVSPDIKQDIVQKSIDGDHMYRPQREPP